MALFWWAKHEGFVADLSMNVECCDLFSTNAAAPFAKPYPLYGDMELF